MINLSKKKIFILGAGNEQVPAIKKCKELGMFVIASDKNNSAPGKILCDKFYCVSIKNFPKNFAIAKKYKIDGIITLCSELAVPLVAKISKLLNLNNISPQTASLATDKIKMKRQLLKYGVKTPAFNVIKNKTDFLKFSKENDYPLVLKPSNLFGQIGVQLIKNSRDISKKIKLSIKLSTNNKAIIEKYYKGKEINIVALVQNKEIFFLSFSYRITNDKNFGIATEHLYPVKMSKKNIKRLKELCYSSIEALKIENGIIYPQVIFSNGQFYLIEIATRIPGGFMRELSMLASGIDPIEFLIYQSLGIKDSLKICQKRKKYNSINIKFFTKLHFKKKRNIKKIQGLDLARKSKGIYDVKFNNLKKIPYLKSSRDRFGAIIACGISPKNAKKNLEISENKISFSF